MRLVLDLQARQTEGSGLRGVGRYAEGLAISAESKAQSIGKAHAHVDRLVAPELLAA